MRRQVLLDTGPLVAFINRRDQYHAWTLAVWDGIAPPLLTCDAVLSEACFLLRHLRGGSTAVLELVARGVVSVPFELEAEAATLAKLLSRYTNVPMSLADACLVRMSEQHAGSAVFTFDGDFRIYRKYGRHVVPTIMPEGM